MSDDKTNRGTADQASINIREAYEVEYWSTELGVSPERLRELVAKHGGLAADIRKVLGKQFTITFLADRHICTGKDATSD